MLKRAFMMAALTGALALTDGLALAEERAPAQAQERIYGSQLMTRQERIEHRSKMRAAKSDEEREQIRNEHHERMKERAKERGMTLPDKPPARRGGLGPDGGMAPVPGMEQGGGRNR